MCIWCGCVCACLYICVCIPMYHCTCRSQRMTFQEPTFFKAESRLFVSLYAPA